MGKVLTDVYKDISIESIEEPAQLILHTCPNTYFIPSKLTFTILSTLITVFRMF